MSKIRLSLLFFQLAVISGFSQNSITGKVTDAGNKETIVGAIVKIEGTQKAVFTDLDGNFSLTGLETGNYDLEITYISYQAKKIKGVKVGGKPVILNISLDPDAKSQLDEVVVSQTKITNTENAAVMEMKKSNSIINTVSAAQISKSQDRDASEVVRRVPGVSILDNRFIMVRGLADRYNNVWLNDVGAPSSEVDKKSFSFDLIQSGLIDRMNIYKTASPELPGDFAGGMVKIYTTAMPEKTSVLVNYQGSYRTGTTGQPFNYTESYKNDWLGGGGKARDFPDGTPSYIDKANPSQDINAITSSFKNDWAVYQKNASPDQRVNIGFNGLVKKGNLKFGSVSFINYTHTHQTLNIHRQSWEDTTQETDYSDVNSTDIARISASQNFALAYKNHKIEFRNFFNQTGRSQVTVRTSNLLKANDLLGYAEKYDQTNNYASQLGGTHSFFKDKTEYTWTGGYSLNKQIVPNYKRIIYTKDRTLPDSNYYSSISNAATITNAGIFNSRLNENIKTFNHNLRQKIAIKNYEFELNAGNYFEYKSRSFIARELGYVRVPGPNSGAIAHYLVETPIASIFSTANLNRQGGFQIQETTNPYDSYTAQNKQVASYLAGSFPIGKHIKLQGGARYEYNLQSLQSKVGTDTITPSITTKYWLPSANFSYSFNFKKSAGDIYKNIIRASYSKTLNRPEFREWAPLYFYDFDFGRSIYGSLYPNQVSGAAGSPLKVAEIKNYDFRYEFYPSAGEYIQVGAFYKTFTNPIQQIILASGGGDSPAFTFKNAESATVKGIEIDVRKNLAFIDKSTGMHFFNNLNLVGNLSIIQSEMYNPSDGNFQIAKTTLQNQSPYLYNLGLYYQNDSIGTQISLLYNVFGSRLYFVGTSSDANIGEIGRKTLDLTISQRIYKKLSITVGVQNMLNAMYRLVQDTNRDGVYDTDKGDKEIYNYRMGAYYTVGLKLKL